MHKLVQLGNIPRMAKDPYWKRRIKQLVAESGVALKPASLAAGLNETGLRDLMDDVLNPGIETLQKVANYFGVPLVTLVAPEGDVRVRVRVIGEVLGGTDSWKAFDDYAAGAGDEDFTLGAVNPIGLRVRGRSMVPAYREGDILIAGNKVYGQSIGELASRDCLVRTKEGDSYCKIVARGRTRGLFNLRSYNDIFAEMVDVPLEWAAPILWVKRS